MARTVVLEVEGAFDAGQIAAGFGDIGDAAARMADDVDAATSSAGDSVGRMDGVADAADNMGSSASQAAGGLGDLGGALSAVPGPLGALGAGMETVAPLVMGVTGATDLMTLAMNSSIVTTVRARVASTAHAAATVAQSAATKVAAAGQWALNAALSANPIGLVVVAVGLLVGGIILAYQKSETFRNIVDTAFGAAKKAIDKVVEVAKDIVDPIKDAADKMPSFSTAVSAAKELVVGYFDAIMVPINKVKDAIQWVIDHLSKLDLPDIPGFGRVAGRAEVGGGVRVNSGDTATVGGVTLISLEVNNGIVGDPDALGRELVRILRRAGVSIGGAV